MSQDYESIGQLSPAAEATLTNQKGWDGIARDVPVAEQPIDQLQAADFSIWNLRANRQTLATTDDDNVAEDFFAPVNHPTDTPPLAGDGYGNGSYDQTPTAATDPSPFQQAPDGTIQGATAAAERNPHLDSLLAEDEQHAHSERIVEEQTEALEHNQIEHDFHSRMFSLELATIRALGVDP